MKKILALFLLILLVIGTLTACGGSKNEVAQGSKGEQGIQGEKGEKGDPGQDGKDAIAPQIRINPETKEWEISSDGGVTWQSTGTKATAENDSIEAISLSKTSLSLLIGETETLIATITPDDATEKDVSWETSNAAVVTVSDGKIVAVSDGEATVTVKSKDGKQATCTVTVSNPAISFGLNYKLVQNDSFYVVTGYQGNATEYTVPAIYNGLRVIGIEANAFKNNTNLSKITLSNNIEYINASAFSGCTNLKEIEIPESVTKISNELFAGCSALESIKIHSNIASIEESAFEACTALKTVTFEDGIERIGKFAFDGCESIEDIVLPNSLKNLGSGAFRNAKKLKSIVLSENISAIENVTFQNCQALKEIKLHSKITTLGNSAFSHCYSLEKLEILGDITSFGNSTFYHCKNLKNIYFASTRNLNLDNNHYIFCCAGIDSEGITLTIANDSFLPEELFEPVEETNRAKITAVIFEEGTSKISTITKEFPYLTSITIPDSVKSIEANPFNTTAYYNTESNWENGILYVGKFLVAVQDNTSGACEVKQGTTVIADNAFNNCSQITSLVIPNTVTKIPAALLSGCSNLQSVTLPFVGESATSSGNTALFGYIFGTSNYTGATATRQNYNSYYSSTYYYIPTSLKSVTITGGDIYSGAFYNCNELTNVTLSNNVKSIGSSAFSGCTKLESITLPFIGAKENSTSNSHFGYIFGASSYNANDDYVPSALKTVIITGGSTVESSAFRNCVNITSITLPDSITSIKNNAFENCSSLTAITIPSKVTDIAYSAFFDCSKLATITVDANNTTYKSIEGNLYSKDEKTLILYAPGKTDTTFTIPDSVTTIDEYAFYNCDTLTSIIIPESVTTIGSYAFNGCDKFVSAEFKNKNGWKAGQSNISSETLENKLTAATYLKSNYSNRTWTRSVN